MGARVHPWQIHVDVWQNQYSIVKLKKMLIIIKKSQKKELCSLGAETSACPKKSKEEPKYPNKS